MTTDYQLAVELSITSAFKGVTMKLQLLRFFCALGLVFFNLGATLVKTEARSSADGALSMIRSGRSTEPATDRLQGPPLLFKRGQNRKKEAARIKKERQHLAKDKNKESTSKESEGDGRAEKEGHQIAKDSSKQLPPVTPDGDWK